jgi:hypothetical protein
MDTPTTATIATAIIIITLPGAAGTNTRAATAGIIQAEAVIKDTAEIIILGNIVKEAIKEAIREEIKAIKAAEAIREEIKAIKVAASGFDDYFMMF